MPKPQDYSNHVRWYPPHHFVFYPLMMALFTVAVYNSIEREGDTLVWIFFAVIIAVVTWVAFMVRQHYALTLQNRIVLAEIRYRYFVITGERFEPLEERLNESQLFALRFVPDDELRGLADRTIRENLPPDAIKKAIKNWRPDNRRV